MFGTTVGKEGTIKIVELGVVIGQFASWKLRRERKQGHDDQFTDLYTFQAECQYVNPSLFNDEDYEPQVFIVTGRNPKSRKVTQLRLDQEAGRVRSLTGRSLLMEGCRLVRSE